MKYVLVSIAIGLLGMLVFFKSKEKTNKIQHLDTELNRFKGHFQNLKSATINGYSNDHKKINNCKLTTINGDKTDIKSMLGNKKKIILCYSELNCNVCIDSVLSDVVSVGEKLGKDKLAILAHYRNPRDLMTFKRINNIDVEIYNYNQGNLNLPIESINAPFLFVSDSTLLTENVFIPIKECPKITSAYFKSIVGKLNLNSTLELK